jgi:hypothetical protein
MLQLRYLICYKMKFIYEKLINSENYMDISLLINGFYIAVVYENDFPVYSTKILKLSSN